MSTDNQKFISESDKEKNQTNEVSSITNSSLEIFNFLSKLNAFKDIGKDDKAILNCQVKSSIVRKTTSRCPN